MSSDFLWLLLTVLLREPCLRLSFYALDKILCNLRNKFVEKCKQCPVFGHKIKTKPQIDKSLVRQMRYPISKNINTNFDFFAGLLFCLIR